MYTVNSNQKVTRRDHEVEIPSPLISIRCFLARMSNEPFHATTKEFKPAICVPMTVHTSNASNKAIVFALKFHWFVKVVDVMVFTYTISSAIGVGTVSTCKRVDAIFLASSMLTEPFYQRAILKESKFYFQVLIFNLSEN